MSGECEKCDRHTLQCECGKNQVKLIYRPPPKLEDMTEKQKASYELAKSISKDAYVIDLREPCITWTFPLKVDSTANLTNEPRYAKTKRKNKQYLYLWTAFANQTGIAGTKRILPYPCTVKMTRVGKKKLDPDNLQFAFKYIRDEIASFILPGLARGKADDDPKIKWEYAQEISKMYFCKIEFFDGN